MNIVISCVAENNTAYHNKVLALFHTIKEFGGHLADAKLIAHYVTSVDSDIRSQLKDIGVSVRIVDPFDARSPHCNKIRMLEIDEDYDVLVMMDCDMVVAGDFSSALTTEAFMAKPCNTHTLPFEIWKSMFDFFKVPVPNHRIRTTYSRVYTVPYFNSGFLSVPRAYAQELYQTWKYFAMQLLNSYDRMEKSIADNSFYTDQFALTLALCNSAIPYFVLGMEYNFSTHHPKTDHISSKLDPLVLHYHWHVNKNGSLKKTGYTTIDRHITHINRFLKNVQITRSIK